jgi:hypothetical protein
VTYKVLILKDISLFLFLILEEQWYKHQTLLMPFLFHIDSVLIFLAQEKCAILEILP